MTSSYSHAIGISFSALSEGSHIYCAIISQNESTHEPRSWQETLTPDLVTALKRLNILKDTYAVVTLPLNSSSDEEAAVYDAFTKLGISFSCVSHGQTLRRAIAVEKVDEPWQNELILDVGSVRTGYDLIATNTEEGICEVDRRVEFRTTPWWAQSPECSSNVDSIMNCVRNVMALLQKEPSSAGGDLHRILIAHQPTPPARELIAELMTKHFPSVVPVSTTCKTTENMETLAARYALERIRPTETMCTFSMTVLRVGVAVEAAGNTAAVRTIIPKHITLPQSRSVDLLTTANTATISIVAGGPSRRVPLGAVKLDRIIAGQKLRVYIDVDEQMHAKVVVKESLPSGEAGNALGEVEIKSIMGCLNRYDLEEAVTADREKEPDETIGDSDRLPA